MKSMTGYGKADCTIDGKSLTIELKAVNNRFLDINMKTPKAFYFLEDALRKEIQSEIKRGRIDVLLTFVDNSQTERSIGVDLLLAKEYLEAAKRLRVEFGLADDFQLTALLKTPDVIKMDAMSQNDELLSQLLHDCAKKAVLQLDKMRTIEGGELAKNINMRLQNVVELVSRIRKFSPDVVREHREKLAARMSEILAEVETDEAKLLNEVAFFADKSNIDEEIARLCSHIEQTVELLKSDEPVGRKLDFIVQELNREANTVCSKSNNINITDLGLELKCEIEKIREQVQNIE